MASLTFIGYFVVITVTTNLFVISTPCFITNCPPGGKRSSPAAATVPVRQCRACGPPGFHGQCYGPNTCCSRELGCLIGTQETEECRVEARLATPCKNVGRPCGMGSSGSGGLEEKEKLKRQQKRWIFNGNCAADGICCSAEICTLDSTCHVDGHEKASNWESLTDRKHVSSHHVHIGHRLDPEEAQAEKPKLDVAGSNQFLHLPAYPQFQFPTEDTVTNVNSDNINSSPVDPEEESGSMELIWVPVRPGI